MNVCKWRTIMRKGKVKKAVIGGIATCVGVFGGAKIYMNMKKEKAAAKQREREQVVEEDAEN